MQLSQLASIVLAVAALGLGAPSPAFTSALVEPTRCTPTSSTAACLAYERCKATHRCARGSEEYTIGEAKLEAFDQEYDRGTRTQVQLVNDFEDWKTGVHHWSVPLDWQVPTLFGFDTFQYPLLGSLELTAGTVYVDTTTATMSGDVSFRGLLLQTPQHTTVAVFNFLTIHLGANVQVKLKGANALSLLSRSSAVINTRLVSPPGMLGGFPGGGAVSQHNINGPGSSNVRVYSHVVRTSGTLEPTVQEIQTSVAVGQTMRGTFTLTNGVNSTARIGYDASAEEMQASLETGLGRGVVGSVRVTRVGQEVAGHGRIWRITFLTALGSVPLLTPTSHLTGLDSTVQTRLITVGNQLSGVFRLNFLGKTTPDLPYNISAPDLASALTTAFDIKSAAVLKDIPTSIERGYTWRIQMTTSRGNVAPTSPTAPATDEPLTFMTASVADVLVDPATGVATTTPYLLGKGAQVTISDADGFSVAFGGKGGSLITHDDLVGGSGGGGGGDFPADFRQFPRPIYGGAGGGAIYVAAINDITIGPNASISVHGEAGESGIFAGGGGSGGSLVLASGTSIHIMGTLGAKGGLGGRSTQSPGGRGTDGEISLIAHAVATSGAGAILSDTDGTLVTTDPYVGAAQTAKSLYLAKSVVDQTPTLEGPTFRVYGGQPTRVSYFLRLGATQQGSLQTNRGGLFGVHHSSDPTLFVVGIGMLEGAFTFSTNARGFPLQPLVPVAHPFQWYQFDILMNWDLREVEIRVNGVAVVAHVPFVAESIDLIGLYTYDAMQTWWDELYVGVDHTMNFHCPTVNANGRLTVAQARQRPLWSPSVVGPPTTYSPPVRHDSHLSRRPVYSYDNGGLVPNDGPTNRVYLNDIRERVYDAAFDTSEVAAGELVDVAISPDISIVHPLETNAEGVSTTATALPKESQYWYSEIQLVDSNNVVVGGGIGACSTTDLITWRNEGIMLHYTNLTDPFGVRGSQGLVASRPKVILSPPETDQQFVMWMQVDNTKNEMGLSGVATAEFPNGPFHFQASFYPGAAVEAPGGQAINETHDQTVVVAASSDAYLIQSYYKTVEYWLPRPVMDPLWESVKRLDGSVDYSLNFHRAFFTKDYDNVDDIYLQRFRSEDEPWSITCCNRVTDVCDSSVLINNERCPPEYRKQVNGLAQFNQPIRSRYKDPHAPQNNAFQQNSVPSHTEWGFQVYNVKTWRGNYFDALSTNITLAMFQLFAGMASQYAIPPSLEVPYPPTSESATFINTTDPPDMMDFILDTLGVPMSPSFLAKFDAFDTAHMDLNADGKLTLDEVAQMRKSGQQTLSAEAFQSFLVEFEALKRQEGVKLDPNQDGQISYGEFENWIGLDPALAFDRFDLDKSGYLDENELSRFLMDRQLPRLDAISIMLDPDFDGRVYYEMFEQFLFKASSVMFLNYDFDKSNDLNASEVALLEADIGVSFVDPPVLLSLLPTNTSTLRLDTYMKWMTASASELRDRVQAFKVDNGLHPTRPDRMTGPQHVVEQRRAKYLSVSKLTRDYLGVEQLLVEMEGDFDGEGALQDMASFALNLNCPPTTQSLVPFRQYLAPVAFGQYASYWNGRAWEPRPSAPPLFTYGQQCTDQLRNPDCLPCLTQSPYISTTVAAYRNVEPTLHFCDNNKELDAYLKEFDHQVSFPLRFQQVARVSSAGVQPHYSPCLNQSESVPCDVLKVYDADAATPWSVAWESRPVNQGTSTKIRAGPMQRETVGQTFHERFPHRSPEPPFATCEINSTVLPDQFRNLLGGG